MDKFVVRKLLKELNEPFRNLMVQNLSKLAATLEVLPVTTATVERMFSHETKTS